MQTRKVSEINIDPQMLGVQSPSKASKDNVLLLLERTGDAFETHLMSAIAHTYIFMSLREL